MEKHEYLEALSKADEMLYDEMNDILESRKFTKASFAVFTEIVDAIKDVATIRAMIHNESEGVGISRRPS